MRLYSPIHSVRVDIEPSSPACSRSARLRLIPGIKIPVTTLAVILTSLLAIVPRWGMQYEHKLRPSVQEDLRYITWLDDVVRKEILSAHPAGLRDIPASLKAIYAKRSRDADELPVIGKAAYKAPELPRLTGTLITPTSRTASLQLPDGSVARVDEGDTICERLVKRIYQRHVVLGSAHDDFVLEVSASDVTHGFSHPLPETYERVDVDERVAANMPIIRRRPRFSTN